MEYKRDKTWVRKQGGIEENEREGKNGQKWQWRSSVESFRNAVMCRDTKFEKTHTAVQQSINYKPTIANVKNFVLVIALFDVKQTLISPT
jgi:hypothetical protein